MGRELADRDGVLESTRTEVPQPTVGKRTLTEDEQPAVARQQRDLAPGATPFESSRTIDLLAGNPNPGLDTSTGDVSLGRPPLQARPTTMSRPEGSAQAPADAGRIPFTVVLGAELRAQIQGIYAHYVKTGKVLELDGVILQLHALALQEAAPGLAEAQIQELSAAGRRLTVDGDGSKERLLAWLLGLAELPTWRKGLPPGESRAWVTMTFEAAEVQRLRGGPAVTPLEQVSTIGSLLDWGWGVVLGDFNEEASIGQIAVNGLLGLIPIVDQALDARDIVANLYFLIGQQRYDEFGPWFGLVITVIGAIPEVGSAVKAIVKIMRNVGARVPLEAVASATKLASDALGTLRPMLETMLRGFAELGVKIGAKVRTLVTMAMDVFQNLLATIGRASDAAKRYFEQLIERAAAVLARLDAKVREALAEIERRLAQIVEDIGKKQDLPNTPNPPTKDVTTPTPTKTSKTTPTKRTEKPPTVPTNRRARRAPSQREQGSWWKHEDKSMPELDEKYFGEVPTFLGDGSMADAFKHKDRYVMKTMAAGGEFDVLPPELATKLWSRIANLNERANQVLGAGVVPKSRAMAPIDQADGSKLMRPVLVQELVNGTNLRNLDGPLRTKFEIEAKQMVRKLATALGMPTTQAEVMRAAKQGGSRLETWTVDENLANFIVTKRGGKDRLVWIDPFFPPSADVILANPKILD